MGYVFTYTPTTMIFMKYITIKTGDIITQIGHITDTGMTQGGVEIFFPDEHEKWSERKCNAWIAENNKRMTDICDFLNGDKKICDKKTRKISILTRLALQGPR